MSATIESQVYTAFDAAAVVQKQRDYFATGKTKDVEFRIQQLKKLRQLVLDNEQSIMDALMKNKLIELKNGFLCPTRSGMALADSLALI